MARFRVDLTLYAELAEIAGEDDYFPAGHVPRQWAQTRVIGSATHHGAYADMYGSEWIGILRRELAADCLRFGVADLDAGVLQRAAPRPLTQRASRVAFNRGFDGIHYRSRYGHDVRNWALFEPFKIEPQEIAAIDLSDADLQQALAIHRLTRKSSFRQRLGVHAFTADFLHPVNDSLNILNSPVSTPPRERLCHRVWPLPRLCFCSVSGVLVWGKHSRTHRYLHFGSLDQSSSNGELLDRVWVLITARLQESGNLP